jgi:hypothetical protein
MPFGIYSIELMLVFGGLIYGSPLDVGPYPLDCRERDHTIGHGNSDGCKSNAPKGSGRIAIEEFTGALWNVIDSATSASSVESCSPSF